MDLISVIVPVYKVEAYLDRCVQSIAHQTYRNLEIILVDDGSPDNCPAMCDAWAQKDGRIKVIHKKNGGGAQARNAGLGLATGDYIAFADSDDCLLPEMYASLMDVIRKTGCDIAECGYHSFEGDVFPTDTAVSGSPNLFTAEEALRENIRDTVCRQLVWNKLYRRSVLRDVRFVEGRFIDDEFFTYRALGNAGTVAVIPEKFYCYRQQQGSAMHQRYSLKWIDAVDAKLCRLLYLKENYPALTVEGHISLLFTCLYHGQMALKYLRKPEQQQAVQHLKHVLSQCGLPPRVAMKNLAFTHRCWLRLARISFSLVCWIRNLIGVGF